LDSGPGDVAGQGVKDDWWLLDPSGEVQRASSEITTSVES
jgi:hypothetical protein